MMRLLTSALAVAFLGLQSASPAHCARGGRWALLIGINGYQSDDVTDLRYAAQDAKALREVLVDREHGAFPPRNVRLLTDDQRGDLAPTKANVYAWLDWLAGRVRTGDTVVLSFSGHGVLRDGKGYLLPMDANTKTSNTMRVSAIDVEDLQD